MSTSPTKPTRSESSLFRTKTKPTNKENGYIHLTTNNFSFIALYKDLKNRGVKNNNFFLKLYDKRLMNVDPFSETLTAAEKSMIWREVTRNPWYFLREICRIPVSGNNKRFELHIGNLALVWSKLMNINLVGILPRQHFKTVSVICLDVYFYTYAATNTNFVYSNKGAGDAQRNLMTFKTIVDVLPDYLKVNHKKDIDNATFIRSAVSNNTIRLAPNPSDAESADKAGC